MVSSAIDQNHCTCQGNIAFVKKKPHSFLDSRGGFLLMKRHGENTSQKRRANP
jgi:hypothetical protein